MLSEDEIYSKLMGVISDMIIFDDKRLAKTSFTYLLKKITNAVNEYECARGWTFDKPK